jgi:iron(III) transport system substrate-binding protein
MPTRRRVRTAGTIVAAITLAALAGGCSSSGGSSSSTSGSTASSAGGGLVLDGETIASASLLKQAQQEGQVTIYEAYGQAKEEILAKAFTAATGIKVNIVELGTAPLITRLESESAAHKYSADVTKMGNQADMQQLATAGDLVPVTPPTAFGIPSTDSFSNGDYYAWTQSPLTVGYNTAKVNSGQVPTSWADLVAPQWKGKIAIPPMSAGGVEIAMYQFLRNQANPDYWQKLAGQSPTIESVEASVVTALANGSVSVAMVEPSDLGTPISQGAQLAFVAQPPEGLPLASNFEAQVTHSPHPAAAAVYLNYTLSKVGQTVISQQIGDYGIRTDVPAPVVAGKKLPALNSGYKFYSVNSTQAIKDTNTWVSQWNKTFNYSS